MMKIVTIVGSQNSQPFIYDMLLMFIIFFRSKVGGNFWWLPLPQQNYCSLHFEQNNKKGLSLRLLPLKP